MSPKAPEAAMQPVPICSPQLLVRMPRAPMMFLPAELLEDSKLEQQKVFFVSQEKGVDEVVARLAP